MISLIEALAPLADLPEFRWRVTHGDIEDYFGDLVWLPDNSPNHELRHDGMYAYDWVATHGDKRFLYIETSGGLCENRDGQIVTRTDLQARFENDPRWRYEGSGGYTFEVDGNTDPGASGWGGTIGVVFVPSEEQ